ncbi:MAG: hypothetical protein K0Q80_405, partial [Microvirga sp.]|nr:hypothetical protein [Microvirga sp.]
TRFNPEGPLWPARTGTDCIVIDRLHQMPLLLGGAIVCLIFVVPT